MVGMSIQEKKEREGDGRELCRLSGGDEWREKGAQFAF